MSSKVELKVNPKSQILFPQRCVLCGKPTENHLPLKIKVNDDQLFRWNIQVYELELSLPICKEHVWESEKMQAFMHRVLLFCIFGCILGFAIGGYFVFKNSSIAIMAAIVGAAPVGVLLTYIFKLFLNLLKPEYRKMPTFAGEWVMGLNSANPLTDTLIFTFDDPVYAAEFKVLNSQPKA